MNLLDKLRQERLARTENQLLLAGMLKCNSCGYWVDKSFIIKSVCNECVGKKEETIVKWI